MSTALEIELRRLARDRIALGLLPKEQPRPIWAGDGEGLPCALCDNVISSKEIAFEYDIHDERFRFHYLCSGVWQIECELIAALGNAA